MIKWYKKHKTLIHIGAASMVIATFLGLGIYSFISGAVFSDESVERWTLPQAVFYGAGLIAVSNMFRR